MKRLLNWISWKLNPERILRTHDDLKLAAILALCTNDTKEYEYFRRSIDALERDYPPLIVRRLAIDLHLGTENGKRKTLDSPTI